MEYSEQISLQDYIIRDQLAAVPSRIAFIDESGNFGFNLYKQGTSEYYVICAVIVRADERPALEQAFNRIRIDNGFAKSEMKSSIIGSNHRRRMKICTEILLLDFSVILLIADKKEFWEESPLVEYRDSFVKYLHQRLYQTMYDAYPRLLIAEDTYGTSEFQMGYRKYVQSNRPKMNLLDQYDFDFLDSKASPLTQLADFIAGSIHQQLEDPSAPKFLNLFGRRITCCTRFPSTSTPYFVDRLGVRQEFNREIYDLAIHVVKDYIARNTLSEDEDTRLKVALLRHLLFVVNDINPGKYVSSKELVRMISEYANRKITPNYFFRKIIASLRDEGVILASSPKGYKIPVSYSDIADYANSTIGVAGPMLSRLGKCRSLILRQTEGKLDILDEPALIKYKNYFDQ